MAKGVGGSRCRSLNPAGNPLPTVPNGSQRGRGGERHLLFGVGFDMCVWLCSPKHGSREHCRHCTRDRELGQTASGVESDGAVRHGTPGGAGMENPFRCYPPPQVVPIPQCNLPKWGDRPQLCTTQGIAAVLSYPMNVAPPPKGRNCIPLSP